MGARGPMKLHLVTETGEDDGTAASRVKAEPPEKPSGLPLEVDELWDELVDPLTEAGLLAACDGPTIEMALRHFAVARKASNKVIEEGSTVADTVHGGVKKSPDAQIFKDNSAAFLEYAKQLGLSFASRARVNLPKDGDDGDNIFGVSNTGT